MFSLGALTQETIRSRIKEYNERISESKQYHSRRYVKNTPLIYFDDRRITLPKLTWSPVGWCKISHELGNALENATNEEHLISFSSEDAKNWINNPEFMENCKSQIPKYLTFLAQIYLVMREKASNSYPLEYKGKVKAKIEELKKSLNDNPRDFIDKPSIIEFINKEIKSSKFSNDNQLLQIFLDPNPETLSQKVLRLRNERIYTTKSICQICKISKYKFYDILKKSQQPPEVMAQPQGRPLNENSLRKIEIDRIVELVEDPAKNYLVPDICADIQENFNHSVSRKMVYYQLTEKLGYSYKRNHFKPPITFSQEQKIVKFKVCQKLIDFMRENRTILSTDETFFSYKVNFNYSWTKKKTHPYRIRRNYYEKRNVMMAISNHNIFAYSLRRGCHNEHTFCAFLIEIASKIISLGPDAVKSTAVIIDQAPFHTSATCKLLISILPFPVLLNAVAESNLQPIETAFGNIKWHFKKMNQSDPYILLIFYFVYEKIEIN